MSEKHKKKCRVINYFEDFLVFILAVSGCVSNFALASFAVVPVGIANSAVELKFCAITAYIKKYKSIIRGKSMIK